MSTTDTLNVKLTADERDLVNGMDNAGKAVKRFGDNCEDVITSTIANFKNLASSLAALGIGKLIKDSITDAMDVVESESLFQTSLGGLSKQAKAWSENISNSFGLNPYALRKNLGTLYNMTTSMGLAESSAYDLSTGVVQLAEDMASFYNLNSEDAFNKLKSGLTGEAEPLKALGILVDENTVKQYAYATGIAEAGAELTQQQKVLARYQAILGQTANAQGDLARTIDSPANQLRIMMNDLQIASVEFGTALMPIVETGLPVLRQVISDVKPVVVDVSTGISTLSSALGFLENPAARSIAYTIAGVVALNKLKIAIGSTASGILLLGSLLTYVLGKYAESQETTVESAESAMNEAGSITMGAGASADKASDSVDKLAGSYEKVSKAASSLMGIDEITKVSGNSDNALASQFSAVESAADAAASSIGDYNAVIDSVSVPEIEIPEITVPNVEVGVTKIDWNELQKDAKALADDITAVFTGDEDERYEALKALNERVKILFGEEWTTFWGGVGNDIYAAFNDFGSEESYQALYNLNERIKNIPFSETFQEIGKSFGNGLADIAAGIEKLFAGDFSGAAESFKSAFVNGAETTKTILDDTFIGSLMGIPGKVVGYTAQSIIDADASEKQEEAEHQRTLADMEQTIKNYLGMGLTADAALAQAKRDYYDGTGMLGGDFVNWYNDLPTDMRFEDKVYDWASEITAEKSANGATLQIENLLSPDSIIPGPYILSANNALGGFADSEYESSVATSETAVAFSPSVMYEAVSAALENNTLTGPIQINTTVELDGDKVGESVALYNAGKTRVSNGRY